MDVQNEPSMEDILASIKRIIADDGITAPGAAKARPARVNRTGPVRQADPPPVADAAQDAEPEEAEILELTEAMPQPRETAPIPEAAISEAVFSEAPPSPPAHPEEIVSHDTASASRQALAALSAMIVKPAPGVDNSLEGLVREMLRPMLKEWLDSKLPEVVEEMVSKEIARITGRIG